MTTPDDSSRSLSSNATSGSPAFNVHRAHRVASVGETIFATMSALAAQHKAANLGQGFPDEDGPQEMLDIAARMVHEPGATMNQYGPGRGLPELRRAIAADRARRHGHELDPETEIAVTVGATEALAASILGLVEEGSEVVALEPTYDAYPAAVGLAGATLVPVRLQRVQADQDSSAGHASFALDREAFAAALSPRTSAILLNTPHNPTGTVLSREDLEFIADCVRGTQIVVITDEVYEHLVFEGTHVPFATLEGMRERTVTISSAAKSFNVTGWKTGWAMAPAELLDAVVAAKQFLSYVGATPFQPAVAWALDNAHDWSVQWRDTLERRRTELAEALRDMGMEVFESPGTYFLISDIAPMFPGESAVDFCTRLPKDAGVAAIPMSVFLADGGPEATDSSCSSWNTLVRWTFCKNDETMATAIDRLRSFTRAAQLR